MAISGRYEFQDASTNSDKFWELRQMPNGQYEVRWGRRGSAGQSTTYDAAKAHKKAVEKISEGYKKTREFDTNFNAGTRIACDNTLVIRDWDCDIKKVLKAIDTKGAKMKNDNIIDKAAILGGFTPEIVKGDFIKHYTSGENIFGYIGHPARTAMRDYAVETYLRTQALGNEAIGFWLSTNDARKFMDTIKEDDGVKAFFEKLKAHFDNEPFRAIQKIFIECEFTITAVKGNEITEAQVTQLEEAVKTMLKLINAEKKIKKEAA